MTDSLSRFPHITRSWRAISSSARALGCDGFDGESLTAGMIASTIADIPGASAVLRGGAVTYCDEIKHRVLGVEQETLDRYTAVSHQTAREMASGSLELYQSDIAVSVTGYAGPGGGTEDDPAGTFYIGWAHRSADGECRSWTLCAATMRATVRVFVPMRSRRHWGALPCAQLYGIDVF
ncbi:MAG: CinA family protein [Collinsella sp.]